MTIHLRNASVASRSQDGITETVEFTYQRITWTWNDGGVETGHDWEPPVTWQRPGGPDAPRPARPAIVGP